jgi:hypothetical protein
LDTIAIVGKEANTERRHFTDWGKMFSRTIFRNGSRDRHVNNRQHPLIKHVANKHGVIKRRLRIGHGNYRAVTTHGGCASSARNRFGGFVSRFTKMRVQINEARSDPTAASIDLLCPGWHAHRCAHLTNATINDNDVSHFGGRRMHHGAPTKNN